MRTMQRLSACEVIVRLAFSCVVILHLFIVGQLAATAHGRSLVGYFGELGLVIVFVYIVASCVSIFSWSGVRLLCICACLFSLGNAFAIDGGMRVPVVAMWLLFGWLAERLGDVPQIVKTGGGRLG